MSYSALSHGRQHWRPIHSWRAAVGYLSALKQDINSSCAIFVGQSCFACLWVHIVAVMWTNPAHVGHMHLTHAGRGGTITSSSSSKCLMVLNYELSLSFWQHVCHIMSLLTRAIRALPEPVNQGFKHRLMFHTDTADCSRPSLGCRILARKVQQTKSSDWMICCWSMSAGLSVTYEFSAWITLEIVPDLQSYGLRVPRLPLRSLHSNV